ncbi:hypothetical protein HDU81_001065, partial [Chytriomyces hyalinus]
RKVLIITGRQLPNLARPLKEDDLMFYYKSLLILFKPHHSMDGLVFHPGQSYKDAYLQFLDTASSNLADATRLHEALNQNHYESNEKDYQLEESDEDRILREHPMQDLFADDMPFPEDSVHDQEDPMTLHQFEEEMANSIARSALEDCEKIDPFLDVALSLSVHATPSPPVASLPFFPNLDTYFKAIAPPLLPSKSAESFEDGATKYNSSLPEHEKKASNWISGNPYTFETYLLLAYLTDAQDKQLKVSPPPYKLKPQLIGYLGGEAGTGKSAVIAALLLFAQLWGRPNTIETMAFMGLAGLMIDGDTIHSKRSLAIDLARSQPLSHTVKEKICCVVLLIVDEVSMTKINVMGAAEERTREVYPTSDICRTKVWGGKHLL